MASSLTKVNEHLSLLKKEYTKLQTQYNELERKYNSLAAQNSESQDASFVSNLFMTVATLYDDETYSDIKIKLADKVVPAHKFVLNARSDEWSKENLLNISELDWSHISSNIAVALMRWLYTDIIDFRQGDSNFALELMRTAHSFRLISLRVQCERSLIASVNVRTCVKFYTAADEIDAKELREHASGVISAYWDDLTGEDFAHLSGPSLYQMLKNKTSQPLHSAIRLRREDVLFLCLVENNSKLRELVNAPSISADTSDFTATQEVPGLLPLELALYSGQAAVANTLLQHGAEIDTRAKVILNSGAKKGSNENLEGLHKISSNGNLATSWTNGEFSAEMGEAPLLHRALAARKPAAAMFLLQNGADVHLTASPTYDTALHLVSGSCDYLRENYNYSHVPADELTCNGVSDEEKKTRDQETFEVAKKLLELKVDINCQNKRGLTPLHIAVISDNKQVFDLLVNQKNIDPNLRTTNEEHTPLYYALSKFDSFDDEERQNYNYYTKKLLEIGARPNPIYRARDNSLMHILAEEEKEDAVIFLCDHVKNLNHVNSAGETVLHVSSTKGLDRLVTELLRRGAMPNMQNHEKKRTALHCAVAFNRVNVINSFINYKKTFDESQRLPNSENFNNLPDFNVKDSEGDTPICVALSEGHLGVVSALIQGGSDINLRNSKGFTLLHQAILKEDVQTALFLLDSGADMNMLSEDNESPLQLAIHCRLENVVESLCERGVSLAAPDPVSGSPTSNGQKVSASPLWCALESGQENIASILVRHGVDTDCWELGPDGCLMTLLHRAIDENKDDIAIFLIQSGCDLNSPIQQAPGYPPSDAAIEKQSPAHSCCQWGLERVLAALIEHGADVNSRDGDMKTPVHVAIENQHEPIIGMLLSLPNIDLSLRDKSGLTPFATALTVKNHKAAQSIVDRLPNAAEQTDGRGRNFLHTAILKGDMESVLFLLASGVDVNSRVQDSDQTPPIHLAALSGDETLLRSLVLAGARVNDRDAHKRTALHVASEAGKSAVISALLQNAADCDALDGDGDNALHVAARSGHLQVARALLTESTIDAEAINLKGRNPLHELCRCAKENAAAICELFLECMPKYPINTPDIQGNSPLLLAYQKGHRALCTVLVRAGACLGAENKDGVNIFNYQVPTKQLLHRLLDQLAQESPWAESDLCQECGLKFTLTVRKHHCRHCGRILCKNCSMQDVPILKFNQNKPVRVCSVCFDVLQIGSG